MAAFRFDLCAQALLNPTGNKATTPLVQKVYLTSLFLYDQHCPQKNHRIIKVGTTTKINKSNHQPAPTTSLSVTAILFFNTSRDRDSTTSLGRLCQCLHILPEKNFSLISNLVSRQKLPAEATWSALARIGSLKHREHHFSAEDAKPNWIQSHRLLLPTTSHLQQSYVVVTRKK